MSSQKVKDWRIRTKARIIESMGGKCNLCGYNRCNTALELHHIDPSKKEISFGSIRANPRSWEKIVEELKKCVLLCANCHREVEANLVELPKDIHKFNEAYTEYRTPPMVYDIKCQQCKIMFRTKEKDRQYCSIECSNLSNRKVERPSKKELALLIKSEPWLQIGKKFGVSDNAVRKWARQYKLL